MSDLIQEKRIVIDLKLQYRRTLMSNSTDYNYILYGMHNEVGRYSWAAFHLFVFLSSLFGDTLILIASCHGGIKVNRSILIMIQNIAASDLGFSVVQILPTCISLVADSWVLGNTFCNVEVYFSFFFHAAGMSHIAVMTTFKYFLLRQPGRGAVFDIKRLKLFVHLIGCLL